MTIVSRGDALGYPFYLPEKAYLRAKDELIDRMIVALAVEPKDVVSGRSPTARRTISRR